MNRRSLLKLALTPFLAPFIARQPLTFKGHRLFPEEAHLPIRWIDVGRIDPAVVSQLQRGVWQSMIPIVQSHDHAIGRISRLP